MQSRLAQRAGYDAILHIDSDELFYTDGDSVLPFLRRWLVRGYSQVTLANHEGVPEVERIGDYFQQVSLFRRNHLVVCRLHLRGARGGDQPARASPGPAPIPPQLPLDAGVRAAMRDWERRNSQVCGHSGPATAHAAVAPFGSPLSPRPAPLCGQRQYMLCYDNGKSIARLPPPPAQVRSASMQPRAVLARSDPRSAFAHARPPVPQPPVPRNVHEWATARESHAYTFGERSRARGQPRPDARVCAAFGATHATESQRPDAVRRTRSQLTRAET